MKEDNKDFIFAGFSEITCDITYNEELEIINKSVGGTIWNVLSNIARLSPKSKCYGFGIYGKSDDSNYLLQQLQNSNIDVKYLKEEAKVLNTLHCILPDNIAKVESVTKGMADSIVYSRVSPITQEVTYDRSSPIIQLLPEELKEKKLIIILENFRKGTLEFLNSINPKNRKIIMDVGRAKIFEESTRNEILELLKMVNVIQISEIVLEKFLSKMGAKKIEEIQKDCDIDLVVTTQGKKGAIFYYQQGKMQKSNKFIIDNPEEEIDPTGAGDAFLSVMTILYKDYLEKNKSIDKRFTELAFNYGNSIARKAVKQVGAKCSDKLIREWIIEEKLKSNIDKKYNEFNGDKEICG